MRLLTCVTENFKKLGNFTAEFTQGLNVVAGDNAKGKSTLLQAIQTALFGVTVVPGKKENIPTWGQKTFKITLTFQLHGDEVYTCVRTDKAAKLTRTLADGTVELVANGNTPVTAANEDLLGLTARDWDLFVQSKQHSSAAILEFGAAALNRKVEEFAGVDLIDKVQAEAQRQSTINNSAADTLAVTEEQVSEAAAAVQSASEAKQLAGTTVEACVQELEGHGSFSLEVPASSETMRAQLNAVVTLSHKLELAETGRDNAKKNVDAAATRTATLTKQDDAALKADLDGIKADGLALADQEKDLQTELATSKRLQQAFDEADLAADSAQQAYVGEWADFCEDESTIAAQAVDASILTVDTDLAATREEVGQAKAAYDNLSLLSDGAVCPTCNRAKEDHDPEKLAAEANEAKAYWENRKASVTEKETTLAQLREDYAGRVSTLAKYNAAAKKVDDATAARDVAKEALKGIRVANIIDDELTGTRALLADSRTKYAEVNTQLQGVASNNQTYEREFQALKDAEAALEAAEQGVKALEADLEALPEPPTEAQVQAAVNAETAYQTAHSEWKQKRQELQSAVDLAKKDADHCAERLANEQNKQESLKTSAAKSLEHLALAKNYARLVQFLRDRRQQYLKEVWDTIMHIGSKLVRTASKDTITTISNDEGDFYYVEDGISAPTASASGAQKAMIGVSLRVGLARALYGKDSLLIFDEPTADCREHNAASLAAMIAGSAKQVLLITHRETDQALAENIVNVGE